jgi:hypothetical protein
MPTALNFRTLDLNLLRVFIVVAERGSVTAAASDLYAAAARHEGLYAD